jgi:hypothetical protein
MCGDSGSSQFLAKVVNSDPPSKRAASAARPKRGCGLHKGARDEGSLIVGETIFREMDGRPPSGGASAPLALGA